MEELFGIIIGISHYKRDGVTPLPGAERDAMTFARALVHWGVPEKNLLIVLNEEATKENLSTLFEALALAPAPRRFLFYFVGHGTRDKGVPPRSYLQLFDYPILLESLIGWINELDVEENLLFIDACNLRINQLEHPRLREEMEGKKSQRCFFSLLSSGIERSFEDQIGKYGYFTAALLKAMAMVRRSDPSPEDLLFIIEEELREKGLPLPEGYNMGMRRFSLLPELASFEIRDGGVHRTEMIAQLQDFIAIERPLVTHVVGEVGAGKSALCAQFASEKLSIVYPKNEEESPPHTLFLFDVAKEAKHPVLEKDQQALIFSSSPMPYFGEGIRQWQIPPFSAEESLALLKQKKEPSDDDELLHLFFQGNPKRMVSAIEQGVLSPLDLFQDRKKLESCIVALISSGGYVDRNLFRKVFGLDRPLLEHLESIGWISEKKYYIPHPLLYELASSIRASLQQKKALFYWKEQLRILPENCLVAKQLLCSVQIFGYEKRGDAYIKLALETLWKAGELSEDLMEDLFGLFYKERTLSEAALYLAKLLVELGKTDQTTALLKKPLASRKLLSKAALVQLKYYLREGRYQECLRLATHISERVGRKEEKDQFSLLKAQAHFFLEEWDQSIATLTPLIKRTVDRNIKGWGLLFLGKVTSQLEGGEKGIPLMELGQAIFQRMQDPTGVRSAFNGIAEAIIAKDGKEAGLPYLEKGGHLAKIGLDPDHDAKAIRLKLLIFSEKGGPFSTEVEEELEKGKAMDQKRLSYRERGLLQEGILMIETLRSEPDARDEKPIEHLRSVVLPAHATAARGFESTSFQGK